MVYEGAAFLLLPLPCGELIAGQGFAVAAGPHPIRGWGPRSGKNFCLSFLEQVGDPEIFSMGRYFWVLGYLLGRWKYVFSPTPLALSAKKEKTKTCCNLKIKNCNNSLQQLEFYRIFTFEGFFVEIVRSCSQPPALRQCRGQSENRNRYFCKTLINCGV